MNQEFLSAIDALLLAAERLHGRSVTLLFVAERAIKRINRSVNNV